MSAGRGEKRLTLSWQLLKLGDGYMRQCTTLFFFVIVLKFPFKKHLKKKKASE